MKWIIVPLLCAFSLACQGEEKKPIVLKTQQDSVSYCIGMDIAKNLKRQEIEIDPDVLSQGLKDALEGDQTILTAEQSQTVMMEFQKMMMAKHTERQSKLAEKNKIEGETFLAENKKKEGVKTTPSGLQYRIIKAGKGAKPTINQTVTVHYTGRLIDGTEFDSSVKRGEPARFPVNGVISGWTEALQMMTVGSKWELFIPSHMAYGERGMGQTIPPNATLIFEVELLSIE